MPVSKRVKVEPYWQSDCGRAVVYVGDMRNVLEKLDRNQFHAVVTDPPYGLEFDVGNCVDNWDAPWKSGGSVDARHRRADEMSDPVKAKYLRHNVEYGRDGPLFQQWFQSCAEAILRVAKPGAHLLSFGGTRMWHRMACAVEDVGWEIRDTMMWLYGSGYPKGKDVGKAIDALLGVERRVVGYVDGVPDTTKVRPGFTGSAHMGDASGSKRSIPITEPATDAAREWDGWNTTLKPAVEPVVVARKPISQSVAQCVLDNGTGAINARGCECDGRWPSNVINDGSDEAIGSLPPGASRYFYSAKSNDGDRPLMGDTDHPTVKPLDLMRYLVRLVCARGGTVLDPFMGSGSTLCACVAEGMYGVGVEQSREYADIAVDRLKEMLGVHPLVERLSSGKRAVKDVAPPPRRLR